MYLNVPTNWDDKIIEKIKEINHGCRYKYKIKQVYGASLTFFGAGRLDTPEISVDIMKNHISKIKQLGILFNFLINAPSIGGIEHDRRYREQIIETLSWINDLGVDMITVSIPLIGELINHYFPKVGVKISTILDVRTIQNIDLLERLGPKIHSVTVSRFVNRDFKLLKEMIHKASYGIELLANSLCLLNCPYQKYHGDLVCWFARINKGWEEPFVDYRSLGCDEVRLNNLSEIIKAPWIRPEDLDIYKNLGVHSIKLGGRTFPTKELIRIIDAYAIGRFDKNLWDLIAPHLPVYVDNSALNGFIDFFVKKNIDCNSQCGKCKYCDDIAQKYVALTEDSEKYLHDLCNRLRARIDHTQEVRPYFNQSIY